MSTSIETILKELVKGFGEEHVVEACQAFLKNKQQTVKVKKPRAKSSWNIFADAVYAEMKKTNPTTRYMDAIKEASRRRKQENTIQQVIEKIKTLPALPKSRGTTEGCRTETNSEYPSDAEEEIDSEAEQRRIRVEEVD
jgi:hypothetical protein